MKNLLHLFTLAIIIPACFISCSKNGNGYATANHTAGMIKSWTWSGYTYGYWQGDSIIMPSPDITPVPWPKYFYRNINDTLISMLMVNDFSVTMLDAYFNYLSTDSVTSQCVTFDSSYANSAVSVLKYFYLKDSMTFESHIVGNYNATANQSYQQHWMLHTVSR